MAEHKLNLLRRRGRAATTGAGSTPPKGGRRAIVELRGGASPKVRTAPFSRRLVGSGKLFYLNTANLGERELAF
jgi:hypothetical protein